MNLDADTWDEVYLSIEDSRWHEALNRGLPMAQQAWRCNHCWHTPSPRVCAPPMRRICCWCGDYEGPQHGPYAEG